MRTNCSQYSQPCVCESTALVFPHSHSDKFTSCRKQLSVESLEEREVEIRAASDLTSLDVRLGVW